MRSSATTGETSDVVARRRGRPLARRRRRRGSRREHDGDVDLGGGDVLDAEHGAAEPHAGAAPQLGVFEARAVEQDAVLRSEVDEPHAAVDALDGDVAARDSRRRQHQLVAGVRAERRRRARQRVVPDLAAVARR
jgi:hypothetical protein